LRVEASTVVLTFRAADNREYRVEHRSSLTEGTWELLELHPIADPDSVTIRQATAQDIASPRPAERYYRLVVPTQ
ncbi:MAG: hypothetical protein KDM81_17965, partial [Verrucomicrobiae bacterium]|nr:hypothetical protein [Verrucomicrobiae bacterium]